MSDKEIYEFDNFRLDAEKNVLWHDEEIVDIKPKAFETLHALVRREGQVATKDELMEEVWEDSFVEENNLSRNIHELRKTFAKLGKKGFIKTIPRRGYCFTKTVHTITGEENEGDEIIIERETIEQTLLEKVNEDSLFQTPKTQAAEKLLPGKKNSERFVIMAVGFLLVLMLLSGSYVFWNYYNSEQSDDISSIESIAVLPLKTFDENSMNEPVGIRITDALITKLGNLNQLSVRSTNSVIPFSDNERNIIEIGKKLEVDAVLDGRVQTEGQRLRVTIQLVSVKSENQLWSEQFDGEQGKILALQDRIANRLRERFNIVSNENFTRSPTQNDEAYEAYLKGRYYWNKRTREGFQKSIELYRTAIDLDPTFARAYAGLADSYVLLNDYNLAPPSENFPKAKAAALKALELDPNLVEPRNTLAYILATYEWNYEEAEKEYLRVIEQVPNYPTAHQWYGEMLHSTKRFDEAEIQLKKARELDPLVPIIRSELAVITYYRRNYDETIKQFAKLKEEFPDFPTSYLFTARAYEQKNMPEDSFNNEIRYWEMSGFDKLKLRELGEAFETGGREGYLKKLTDQMEAQAREKYIYEYRLAHAYARSGNRKKTLEWLEKGVKKRSSSIVRAYLDPNFDFLRDDPEFQKLIAKMNFPN